MLSGNRKQFNAMRTHRIILDLLLLLLASLSMSGQDFSYIILTNPDVENSEAFQEGNAYQRDFLLFVDMLENTHPMFVEADKKHYDMDSLTHVGYQYLAECENENMFKQYLQSILSPLNDGHSAVMMDFKGDVCPFKFFAEGDTVFYLTGITKDYSIEEIRNFLFDENRKPGDLLTTYESATAYYIVRYVSTEEKTYRDQMVESTLWNKYYTDIASKNEVTVDEELMKHANTNLIFNASSSTGSES